MDRIEEEAWASLEIQWELSAQDEFADLDIFSLEDIMPFEESVDVDMVLTNVKLICDDIGENKVWKVRNMSVQL